MKKTKKEESNIFSEEIDSKIKTLGGLDPVLKFKLTRFLSKLKNQELNFHLLFLELKEIENLNPMFSEKDKKTLLNIRNFVKKVNAHYAKINSRTTRNSLR